MLGIERRWGQRLLGAVEVTGGSAAGSRESGLGPRKLHAVPAAHADPSWRAARPLCAASLRNLGINFDPSVCLSFFPPSCLRNEVEIALAMSFWRDLTAERRSEACKRERYLSADQPL